MSRIPGFNHNRWAAFALGSMTLLGACGSDSGSSGDTAAGSDAPTSFDDIEWKSPIQEFLGYDVSSQFGEDDQEEFIAREREAGELVVACMAAEGFEYTPEDPSNFFGYDESNQELPYGSREWVERYGFGVSTQMFSQEEVGPDLIGHDYDDQDSEWVDPNQEYLDTLSSSEQEAFYAALYGQEPEVDTEGLTDEEMNAAFDEAYADLEPTGCQNTAYEQAWNEDEGEFAVMNDFYEEFGDEFEQLYEGFEDSPEVTEFRAEVQACVEAAGQVYVTSEDAWEHFGEQLDGIGPNWDNDPFVEAGLDPESMSEEEIDAFLQELNQFDPADKAALAEVQAEEIGAALAAFDCGGGDIHETVKFQELQVQTEEQFLADNADRLAPYAGAGGTDG